MVFLPPANDVWGKVIFLQASVCPQVGGSLSREVSVKGGLCLGSLSRGSMSRRSLSGSLCPERSLCPEWGLYPGGSLSRGSLNRGFFVQGVSVQRGVSVQGGLCPGEVGLCPGWSLAGNPLPLR